MKLFKNEVFLERFSLWRVSRESTAIKSKRFIPSFLIRPANFTGFTFIWATASKELLKGGRLFLSPERRYKLLSFPESRTSWLSSYHSPNILALRRSCKGWGFRYLIRLNFFRNHLFKNVILGRFYKIFVRRRWRRRNLVIAFSQSFKNLFFSVLVAKRQGFFVSSNFLLTNALRLNRGLRGGGPNKIIRNQIRNERKRGESLIRNRYPRLLSTNKFPIRLHVRALRRYYSRLLTRVVRRSCYLFVLLRGSSFLLNDLDFSTRTSKCFKKFFIIPLRVTKVGLPTATRGVMKRKNFKRYRRRMRAIDF